MPSVISLTERAVDGRRPPVPLGLQFPLGCQLLPDTLMTGERRLVDGCVFNDFGHGLLLGSRRLSDILLSLMRSTVMDYRLH